MNHDPILPVEEAFLNSLDLAHHIIDVIEDKKAENIILLDIRPKTVISDYFIIANGNSDRQLKALADYVREGVKEKFETLPYSVEGTAESGWILIDYGYVVVHLFVESKREYYDLEGLWREANVVLSIQ